LSRTAAVYGILLAAGESRRMGFPKPLLRIDGETYLERLVAAMRPAVDGLIIVLGAHREMISRAIPRGPGISTVTNPNYPDGQLSSLKVALRRIPENAAAVMVHLIDHPTVTSTTFSQMVETWRNSPAPILIARYRGRRGHPVIFERRLFDELLAAPDNQGARIVVNADPDRVTYCEVEDPGVSLDLDTPADLIAAGLEPPPVSHAR
jgi:molybdenum cofactor cytidylyltransferase